MTPKPKAEETLKACPFCGNMESEWKNHPPDCYLRMIQEQVESDCTRHYKEACEAAWNRRTPAKDEVENEEMIHCARCPQPHCGQRKRGGYCIVPTAPADEGTGSYPHKYIADLQAALVEKEKRIEELEAGLVEWKDGGKQAGRTILRLRAELKSAEAVVEAAMPYLDHRAMTARDWNKQKELLDAAIEEHGRGSFAKRIVEPTERALEAMKNLGFEFELGRGEERIVVCGPCWTRQFLTLRRGQVLEENICYCNEYDNADPKVVGYPPFHEGCTCVVEKVE